MCGDSTAPGDILSATASHTLAARSEKTMTKALVFLLWSWVDTFVPTISWVSQSTGVFLSPPEKCHERLPGHGQNVISSIVLCVRRSAVCTFFSYFWISCFTVCFIWGQDQGLEDRVGDLMRFQEVFGSEMPKVSIQSRFTLDFDDKKSWAMGGRVFVTTAGWLCGTLLNIPQKATHFSDFLGAFFALVFQSWHPNLGWQGSLTITFHSGFLRVILQFRSGKGKCFKQQSKKKFT